MSDGNIWIVRAGRGGVYLEDFVDSGCVATGWDIDVNLGAHQDKSDIEAKLEESYPDESSGTIGNWASQIVRYFNELELGDSVTTYDPSARVYYLGEIESDVELHDHDSQWRRRVRWNGIVPRDALRTSTRNTLGSTLILFLVKDDAATDMRACMREMGDDTEVDPPLISPIPGGESEARELLDEAVARSSDFIEDRIASLNWEQMQELVAEILKAMGYRTRVSPRGADRGVDVFASPDGLGLQEPRIFVEVKHRRGTQITSQDVRSFLGGRQQGDRCLYVSTGGFSKDAKYEAERSNIPLTLIALPALRELLVQHYESMSAIGTSLVPLERVYWPV